MGRPAGAMASVMRERELSNPPPRYVISAYRKASASAAGLSMRITALREGSHLSPSASVTRRLPKRSLNRSVVARSTLRGDMIKPTSGRERMKSAYISSSLIELWPSIMTGGYSLRAFRRPKNRSSTDMGLNSRVRSSPGALAFSLSSPSTLPCSLNELKRAAPRVLTLRTALCIRSVRLTSASVCGL